MKKAALFLALACVFLVGGIAQAALYTVQVPSEFELNKMVQSGTVTSFDPLSKTDLAMLPDEFSGLVLGAAVVVLPDNSQYVYLTITEGNILLLRSSIDGYFYKVDGTAFADMAKADAEKVASDVAKATSAEMYYRLPEQSKYDWSLPNDPRIKFIYAQGVSARSDDDSSGSCSALTAGALLLLLAPMALIAAKKK